jgi:hypothetical protein
LLTAINRLWDSGGTGAVIIESGGAGIHACGQIVEKTMGLQALRYIIPTITTLVTSSALPETA